VESREVEDAGRPAPSTTEVPHIKKLKTDVEGQEIA
jgi:hypothetical protein